MQFTQGKIPVSKEYEKKKQTFSFPSNQRWVPFSYTQRKPWFQETHANFPSVYSSTIHNSQDMEAT